MPRLVFLCFGFLGVLLAQNERPAEGPPIRVQVNEVIVPVTVTDDKGRFVSNLDQSDFKIFDESKEQKIQFFSRERNAIPAACAWVRPISFFLEKSIHSPYQHARYGP